MILDPERITEELLADLRELRFGPPVSYVYNPLEYARLSYTEYFRRYGSPGKEVVLVGMNPGPWGMAQTGVPFGEVTAVRDWLGIRAPVTTPVAVHPKRPVEGFACKRSEVSGRRLWGWARETFGTPERFFGRFFVANYCPLLFLEESGRNRTPDRIPARDRAPLFAACDKALRDTIQWMGPRHVVGIGHFTTGRCHKALKGLDMKVGRITHPSPANPKANQGWAVLIQKELSEQGIRPE